MALLDLAYPAHVEQRATYASGFPGGTPSSSSSSSNSSGGSGPPTVAVASSARDSLASRQVQGDMQAPPASLSASASSGSLAPPPGLPRSSSTAELVALGFDPSGGMEGGNDLNSSDGGGGGAGYDPRPPAMSGSGGGGVGGGLDAGDMGGKDDGTSGIGTGSAGGMGLGLRNHSLTNLANMVRSQSVSSFHSEIFASGGNPVRSAAIESPAWGSYPANLDKMGSGGGGGGGGEDIFTVSPSMGPRGAGRGTLPMRPPTGGGDRGGVGGGGGDVGGAGAGADLSPQQFAGRGTAARREVVDRGMSAAAAAGSTRTSQRRPMGGGSSFDPRGIVPSAPGRSGAPPSGRAMVHNRSDTDLVASFSRLGFGQGGVSRWSPLMSPTASPLVGAPLLEEDPLDLELEENASRGAGAGAGGAAADTFGAPSSFLTSHGRRGLMDGHGASGEAPGMEVRLPRHASYPSLTVSRGGGSGSGGGGYGMEDLVHGALEHLTAGDSATGAAAPGVGEGSGSGGGGSGSGLASGGMSSSSLSGSAKTSSAVNGAGGSDPTAMVAPGALGGGAGYTSSPGHSPASGSQGPPQGMGRQNPRQQQQQQQQQQHRSHHPQHQQSYDHGRGGVDGVMMRDGRFVPSGDGGGGHPGMMYGDGGGYGGGGMGGGGYDGMGGGGAPGGMMDVPWGGQDPVAVYQALLMKQSLAAAHASGMRFPHNMHMPAGNGMGMNMVDVAALAAAAQAASATPGGRGGYSGGGGGGGGGYPGMSPHMQQGGYGRRDQRMGPRGDMGGGEYGMGGPMGGGGGAGPRMGGMGGRNGGMYDVVEDVGDGNVYHVQFKRSARNFLLAKTCQRDLQVGDYVKVEADRGEDLGMVVTIFPVPEAGRPLPATAGQKRGFGQFEKEHIIRAATEDEVQMVKDKLRDEERVLEVCRTKVLQRSLPMRVMDAEFQYDRHKLTFFFEAEGRIDFRELVRDLFSLYKTRIWMQQLEPETTPSGGAMQPPYSPQQQQMHGMPDAMKGGSMDMGMNMGGTMGGPML